MGFFLLAIENLVVSLLLSATVFSCIGRLQRRWLRNVLWIPFVILLLSAYGAVTVLTHILNVRGVSTPGYYWGAPLVSLGFLVGCIALIRWGFRRDDPESAPTAAALWPRGKLAIALGVAVVLHLMTFWNMDLAAKQRIEALRGEAGSLALSVAPPRVPDRDNAAILYEQAFDGLFPVNSQEKTLQQKWDRWTNPDRKDLDLNDPELRQFLPQENAGRIALLHKAAAKSGCYFEHNYAWPTVDMLLPEVMPIRQEARLLALDARVKTADGDRRGALQDVNSIFALSQHVSSCPTLISMLISMSTEQMAVELLQEVLAAGNVAAEDLSRLQLDGNFSYHRILERDLRMDEAFRLASFSQVGTGELDLRVLSAEEIGGSDCPNGWLAILLYRVFLLPDDLADHRRLSQQLKRLMAKPYCEAATELKQFDELWKADTAGLLTRMLFPALGRCREAVARADALRQAVLLGLAAKQFQARNNRYPDRIEELVPDFVPTLPRDPFDGEPMRMRQIPNGLVFYSFGPDLADNHGDPFDQEKRTGDISFKIADPKP